MLESKRQADGWRRAMFVLGTVIGVLLGGGGVYWALGQRVQPEALPEPPAPTDALDWRESAMAITMPDRRSYTLPLNNPDMIAADKASFMRDEDLVIGVLFQGQARAYPWWATSNYHVVNDTVEGEPLLVTLCEVCGGACAYRPTVPEDPLFGLVFQICGVSHATIEIADYQTQSKWHPFLGTSFEGPLKGKSLERYPVLVMNWKEWKRLYPGSVVANASDELRLRPHGAEAGQVGDVNLPGIFAETANLTDKRMGLHDLVLGIHAESGQSYVIPVSELVPFPNLFLISLEKKPVLIVRQSDLAVAAFDLEAYGAAFTIVSKEPIQFRSADGFVWNAAGINTSITDREVRLPTVRSYLTEWYEWVSHSPKTEIVHLRDLLLEAGSGAASSAVKTP